MVFQDNNLEDMSWQQWTTVSQPKIQGTWDLHNALIQEQAQPVDQFFLFSSAGAVSGQWDKPTTMLATPSWTLLCRTDTPLVFLRAL